MSAIFRDARLKDDRANKHVEELKAAIFSLKESNTARIEKNLETGHQELIHTLPGLEDALLNLSLIVGDAIHNLHTALDFAWVSTIERHIPAASSKFTKFPVRETREKLEAALHGAKIDTACPSLFNK